MVLEEGLAGCLHVGALRQGVGLGAEMTLEGPGAIGGEQPLVLAEIALHDHDVVPFLRSQLAAGVDAVAI